MSLSFEILSLLFLAALAAGWVDAIAGGGGLITIPALLLTGLPPAGALATNKLQGCFGAFTAALYFIRRKSVNVRENLMALVAIAAGSAFGGWLLLRMDASVLVLFIPVLLVSIGLYYLFFGGKLDDQRPEKMTHRTYSATVAPLLGFYDGVFGPGTGSFMSTTLILLRGMPIRTATAHAKLYNFMSNLAALVYFIFFGKIFWLVGAVMIVGQICGAWLGAHLAFKGGAKIIRPITVIVCFVMSLRVLWKVLYG